MLQVCHHNAGVFTESRRTGLPGARPRSFGTVPRQTQEAWRGSDGGQTILLFLSLGGRSSSSFQPRRPPAAGREGLEVKMDFASHHDRFKLVCVALQPLCASESSRAAQQRGRQRDDAHSIDSHARH